MKISKYITVFFLTIAAMLLLPTIVVAKVGIHDIVNHEGLSPPIIERVTGDVISSSIALNDYPRASYTGAVGNYDNFERQRRLQYSTSLEIKIVNADYVFNYKPNPGWQNT